MGVLPRGWCIREHPNLNWMMIWGYPYFRKPPWTAWTLKFLICRSSWPDWQWIHMNKDCIRSSSPKKMTLKSCDSHDHWYLWWNIQKITRVMTEANGGHFCWLVGPLGPSGSPGLPADWTRWREPRSRTPPPRLPPGARVKGARQRLDRLIMVIIDHD